MTESDVFAEFERLWQAFRTCCATADELQSPNPEDGEFIKMAIVGFCRHQSASEWRNDHFRRVVELLHEYDQPEDTATVKRFAMLGHGALLGLYSAGTIDDRVYRIGYMLLPGFIMGKGGAIDLL